MNLVETFFYAFEAETKRLEEGLRKGTADSKKLEKGLTDADKAAARLNSTFLAMAKGVGKGLLAGFSVAAVALMIRNTINHTDALTDQADALGVSVGQLDLWDAAATTTGGTAGAFATSLATVNERIQEVARKGSPELLGMFQKVGLSLEDIRKNAADPIGLLREMSDQFAELSEAEAAGLGKKMGLDPGTVNLLRQGRTGLDEIIARQKELGYITDEQSEAAGKYNDVLDASRRVWADLRRQFVTSILPVLTWVGEKFQDLGKWVRENSTFVVAGIGVVATALTGMLLPAILRVSAALLTNPLTWIVLGAAAAAAALTLLVDDLHNFMAGNDSLIGEMAAKWPWVGTLIRGVGETVAHLFATVVEFASAFVALFVDGPAAALAQLDAGILQVGASLMEQVPFFRTVGEFVGGVIEGIVAAWRGFLSLLREGLSLVSSAGGVLNKLTGGVAGRALNLVTGGASMVGAATASPVGAVPSSAIGAGSGDRTSTVNIDRVEVNTQATDADGIAKGIGKSLGDEMRSTADFFDDGVAA